MNKSAVIIGGGLGGLFTGAILAKEGIQVTILEKNATAGGGLQSFRRFGETYDAGMHILGGLCDGGSINKLCRYLGILDKMHIRHVDDDCMDEIHFLADGTTYCMKKGRKGFVEYLSGLFPGEKENLVRYVDAMYRIADDMDLFQLRPLRTTMFMHTPDFFLSAGDFIAKYIDDPKLQSLLAYMNPLYGGYKDKTPAYIHAIINVLYINGGSRLEGGCCLFVDVLTKFIEDHGGQVIVNDGVVKVSSEEKLITSVTTKKGRQYSADYYISDIHPCSFISLLEDKKILPKPYRMRLDMIPNTYSNFSIFLKLKPGCVKYINHSCYIMSDYEEMWNIGKTDDSWPRGVLYMTTPELNQEEYATKMIITTPMAWDIVKPWEDTTVGHRGKEYEQWKHQQVEKMLALMQKVYPNFRDYILDMDASSPLTVRDYFGVKDGSMYGYAPDCNNMILSQLPVVTKVKNLLLTGQNNNIHGFCGVPLTAINTCEAILGLNFVINKIAAMNP